VNSLPNIIYTKKGKRRENKENKRKNNWKKVWYTD